MVMRSLNPLAVHIAERHNNVLSRYLPSCICQRLGILKGGSSGIETEAVDTAAAAGRSERVLIVAADGGQSEAGGCRVLSVSDTARMARVFVRLQRIPGAKDAIRPGSSTGKDVKLPGSSTGEDAKLPGSSTAEDPKQPGSSTAEDAKLPGSSTGEDAKLPGISTGEDAKLPGNLTGEDAKLPGNSTAEDGKLPGSSPQKSGVVASAAEISSPASTTTTISSTQIQAGCIPTVQPVAASQTKKNKHIARSPPNNVAISPPNGEKAKRGKSTTRSHPAIASSPGTESLPPYNMVCHIYI